MDGDDFQTQAAELRALGISVIDQFDIEQNVEAAVDKAVASHSRKQKLQIIKREMQDLNMESKLLDNKKANFEIRLLDMQRRVTDPRQYLAMEKELKAKIKRQKEILERGSYLHEKLQAAEKDEEALDNFELDLEDGEILEEEDGGGTSSFTQKAKLIESGEMTPFGTVMAATSFKNSSITKEKYQLEPMNGQLKIPTQKPLKKKNSLSTRKSVKKLDKGADIFKTYLQDQIEKQKEHSQSGKKRKKDGDSAYGFAKKPQKRLKEFIGSQSIPDTSEETNDIKKQNKSPLKLNILHPKHHFKERNLGSKTSDLEAGKKFKPRRQLSETVAFETSDHESDASEYTPSDDPSDDEENDSCQLNNLGGVRELSDDKSISHDKIKKGKKNLPKITKTRDDAYVEDYERRLNLWKKEKKNRTNDELSEDEDEFEEFEGGLKIPLHVWNKLFKYQKICVKWLWELHCQRCGGILGDEMGLGKTIEVISFLVGLSISRLSYAGCKFKGLGPVLIVCPATVLHQWVKELHKWWPPFRVAVLHGSGVFTGTRQALIHNINRFGGILVTSYTGMRAQLNTLLQYEWHYVILDEGHKIRNPEAQITVAVKRFQTIHRLILSGSPIQNSLKELWSLFDFVFPGKLGSLPVFLQQFSVPITMGGYANASKSEVQIAFRCATVLRDTINPYLLRRMKNDVRKHLTLPDKNEQVLFCALTDEQRAVYRQYLDGDHVSNILKGRMQVFVGLINLRKMCNHPDLYTKGPRTNIVSNLQPELQYGWWQRSGKMLVLHAVLKLWQKQDHRVLLFTQSRQMMCILEKFLQDQTYTYCKMDGGTAVGSRQPLIEKFNKDSSIFVFLLTTRVGGLGVNLTGADRVIIFDPDWNPSTDSQARERAWRIGQLRHVTIYRFLTSGTIEEKIYHRQIFKQFLTNRILKDPKQQRFFKTNDLHELFSLSEGNEEKSESSAIFAGTGSEIKVKNKKKVAGDDKEYDNDRENVLRRKSEKNVVKDEEIVEKGVKNEESEETGPMNYHCHKSEESDLANKEKMIKLAKLLSKKIAEKKTDVKGNKSGQKSAKTDVKDDKNRQKPKKHKKGRKFEGERIEHLVKKRKYKDKCSEEDELEGKGNKNQDEYVLKKLFKSSGVHTALSHDVIVNGGDTDYILLESEADRVAKEAMKQVRASRRLCSRPRREKEKKKPVFGAKKNSLIDNKEYKNTLPKSKKQESKLFNGLFSISDGEDGDNDIDNDTTGNAACSSNTQKLSFGGPSSTTEEETTSVVSSSQLLLKMKHRNESLRFFVTKDSDSDIDDTFDTCEDNEHLELLTDIRNFVAFQSDVNGKASTQEVINKFRDRLPNNKTHIFRALLKEICEFCRGSDGIGYWHLRGEFR